MGDRSRQEVECLSCRSANLSFALQACLESAETQPLLRALLVSDLEGFTPMLCTLGDLAARDVIAIHDKLLRDCLKEHHGVERAHTGDGVIASFVEAQRAVSCAAAIQHRLRRYNERAPKAAAINARIGVHAGPTLIHDTRLFGAAVNTAVRLCSVAGSGEVVISEAVRRLVRSSPSTLRDLGPLSLKGLPAPVRAFALDWRNLGSADSKRARAGRERSSVRFLARTRSPAATIIPIPRTQRGFAISTAARCVSCKQYTSVTIRSTSRVWRRKALRARAIDPS